MAERNEILTLAGKDYAFRTPKIAIIMSALLRSKGVTDVIERTTILVTAQAEWVRSGIGADAWTEIEARLMDPEDPIDWPDITKAFEAQMSGDSGRPTTSSQESSVASPATTSPEAKPSPAASMFGL